ncbi:flagellar hook-length control protein FliK [Paenibacillus montanisoli]|uniref:Flagellar hook-length control protein-like C-terminal domain-containing protein n=1 Tax=Paenibacillus montanisoli TaxID=2081970 RepID=A0A328U0E1_9BACL|nr:flagellar hook-length control protein FliK [Paenibacillus montanisoli]RAP76258.1 hypothetical protein DL346_12695 [Paenibacillus montanisoli]
MQMSISNAAPRTTAQGTSAAAKGAEAGNEFNQTLVQTLASPETAAASIQTAAGTNVVAAVPVSALASLLGENSSSADLLAAIEELLNRLSETDAEELAQTTSEGQLSDALVLLDDLLSMLSGMPVLQPAQVPDGGLEASDSQASATVHFEVLEALKSGLQDALQELRMLAQQQKRSATGREQNAIISKQLVALEQLLSGTKADSASATGTATADVQGDAAVSAIRSLQSVPASNTHLQRMSHQFLHVGLLKAYAKPEQEHEGAPLQLAMDPNSINLAAFTGSQELQRQQLAASKQIGAEPVPVQQFASTIQGMVVKQFHVTAGNGISNAQLTLYPEHLGQVNVNITMHNGTLTAQFLTDTATAKDMLENQMAHLRSALQSHGLHVDKLEVSQTQVQTNLFQDRQGHGGRDQSPSKRNSPDNDSVNEIDFNSDLDEISTQLSVDRDLGLGRGIHTTA